MGDIDHLSDKITHVAAEQQGNVTRPQLLAMGLTSTSINRWIKRGRLFREYQGVYSVGRPANTSLEKAAAAVLACGDRAALSHGSAMTLWGFWKRWDQPFEVTVANDRRPKGIRVHRAARLLRRDICVRHDIRVTSPARTLLDMAPPIPARSLTRFVNDGRRGDLITLDDLADLVRRFPTHPGARLLRRHVDTTQNPTRSGFEDDFLPFCERFELPTPLVNVMLHGFEVDAYFEAERLIVELDGWSFHNDRGAFEGDRERDAAMLALGIATIRITKRRLKADPEREAARLHAILEDRRRLLAT